MINESKKKQFKEFSAQALSQLFELEDIKLDGYSIKQLQNWGGIQKIASEIKTNISLENIMYNSKGIEKDENQMRQRVHKYGSNDIIFEKPETLIELIKQNYKTDTMIRKLTYASILSLFLGMITEGLEQGWVQGASILFGVAIILLVNSVTTSLRVQNHALASVSFNKTVTVIRGGQQQKIDSKKLLVGDIMKLQIGQMLPVDGVLLLHENQFIMVNEENLSDDMNVQQQKNTKCPFLLSGSSIISSNTDNFFMIVLAVGVKSFYYKISVIQKRQTSFEKKLKVLMEKSRDIGICFALIFYVIMTVRYILDCLRHPNSWNAFFRFKTLDEMVQYFIITIGIVIISIPEGLPLAITITLYHSKKQMAKQKIQIRHLYACQTLGSTNYFIVDKTGILTTNNMIIQDGYMFQKQITSYSPQIIPPNMLDILRIVINASCTDSFVVKNGAQYVGDKFSTTMIEMVQDKLLQKEKLKKQNFIKVFPFDSQLKRMTALYEIELVQNNQAYYKTYICSKGIPEVMINLCNRFVDQYGNIKQINNEFKQKVLNQFKSMAKQSMRVILFAYRQCDQLIIDDDRFKYQDNFICLGLIGVSTPLQQNVSQVLQTLEKAGIHVIMTTGESKSYALSLAKQINFIPQQWKYDPLRYDVINGKTFHQIIGGIKKDPQTSVETIIKQSQFKKLSEQLKIVTRVTAEDKYDLMAGLQYFKHTVATAVTADHVQDLSVLAKADVGITMQGTGMKQIQKLSEIHLSNGKLKSLVTIVKWGRNIIANIKKIIIYQTTINLVALTMAFIGGIMNKQSPLSSVQMLWINVIINTMASFAFATQHPFDDILQKKPYSKYESSINKTMWINIFGQSIAQIAVLCVVLFRFSQWMGIPPSAGFEGWNQDSGRQYAIFFNVFVYLQIFNQLNTRRYQSPSSNIFKNLLSNKYFLIIFISTFFIQILLSQIGGEAIRTTDLSIQEQLLCMMLGSISLVVNLIVKTFIPSQKIKQMQQRELNRRILQAINSDSNKNKLKTKTKTKTL